MTKKKKVKKFHFQPKKIPMSPGCYLFWDKNNELLYVGKAKNLRKRVSSYFQQKNHSPRIRVMVSKIANIETRIVGTETEALILENNLIKEFFPRFNVRLRDDKNFVYLHITKETIPKMEITRRIVRDGSYYLGPKTATKEFRKLIRFCQKFFHVRMTKVSQDYYPDILMGKYDMSEKEYQQNVDMMKKFLNGQTKEIEKILKERMLKFAEEKNFEAAAKTRDTLESIATSTQKQSVSFSDTRDRDFIGFVRENDRAYFVRIAFRNGQYLDQNEIQLEAKDFLENEELIHSFLMQFYLEVDRLPHEIYISQKIGEEKALQEFLLQNIETSHTLKILVPQKGEKKQILKMAEKSAENFKKRKELEELSRAENFAKALPELAESLGLKEPPARMECFDISHFSGDSPVASQVVFIDGEPKNTEYRRFKVKSLGDGKIDDFASLREILSRRFARKYDKRFAKKFPNFIIIDGGKGQLSSVMKAVKEFEKENQFPEDFNPQKQIIALAKREEEIFRPGQKDPLLLPIDSSSLKLLQRIRDEAHRFAISYNRVSRQKKAHQSILDEIKGIGSITKKKLLKKFGSVSSIRKAKDKDLLSILNPTQLKNIRKNL